MTLTLTTSTPNLTTESSTNNQASKVGLTSWPTITPHGQSSSFFHHHLSYQQRIDALRNLLDVRGVDGFIVPRTDQFQGEMISSKDERLQWLTGFSGSAGLCMITKECGVLFVDGRYTTQAKYQSPFLDQKPFTQQAIKAWMEENLDHGMVLGFDPWLHTVNQVHRLQQAGEPLNLFLQDLEDNPIDSLWVDRLVEIEKLDHDGGMIEDYSITFAGVSRDDKLERLFAWLNDQGLDGIFLSESDTISWLLNIRGHDVPYTPLVQSIAYFSKDNQGWIFVRPTLIQSKTAATVPAELSCRYDLTFVPLSTLGGFLHQLNDLRISVDPTSLPWRVHQGIKNNMLIYGVNPCILPKACKNPVEIQGAIGGHIQDAIAVVEFWAWLDGHYLGETESSAQDKLLCLRQEQPNFISESFAAISAMNANGAIIHYHAKPTSAAALTSGIYLIDSGGQYRGCTTDITRTFLLGEALALKRERDLFVDDASTTHSDQPLHLLPKDLSYYQEIYTCVLKGHIDLAKIVFPNNTTGGQLDTLARQYLWQRGLDYPHGTGHGVGSFLNVHEGPQRIGSNANTVLEPGMIVSNEPGYYDPGHFGIRIENLMVVENRRINNRDMLGFRTLTMVPYDHRLIKWSMIDDTQRLWLKEYYDQIRYNLDGKVSCPEFLMAILKII